jgi:tRNA pseudouridine13 synthase
VDAVRELPLLTADLPGTGGRLKISPAHFVVEEIPAYEPCGEGAHVYLEVRREGMTTRDVQRALAGALGVAERDVGCAGQKDKVSRATQTFSLPLASGAVEEIASRAAAATGLEVLAAKRHRNKLGRGHLAGNRFAIVVADVGEDAVERARAILARLEQQGLPNFFGEQRLGPGDRNARRGARRLDDATGAAAKSWIARMELSAWQSALFNAWLRERMARGWFDRVLAGDVARKEDTGGLFEVVDAAKEGPRFARGEISVTGPIYGAKMRPASGEPGELERAVLEAAGVDASALAGARLAGSRRPARVFPRDTSVALHPEGLHVAFRLPKGAFATMAMREITKAPV